jgi:hypothetical protein
MRYGQSWYQNTQWHNRETENLRKSWNCTKNGSRRVWKILKLSAAAGSAYGHFFLREYGRLSCRKPLEDELSLACKCAKESGMIGADCFLAKALWSDVVNSPDLKLETLLCAAEAGNSLAQIEVADMYAIPLLPIACVLPSHHVAHCRAVTARGVWYPKLFAGTRLPVHKTAISASVMLQTFLASV